MYCNIVRGIPKPRDSSSGSSFIFLENQCVGGCRAPQVRSLRKKVVHLYRSMPLHMTQNNKSSRWRVDGKQIVKMAGGLWTVWVGFRTRCHHNMDFFCGHRTERFQVSISNPDRSTRVQLQLLKLFRLLIEP